MAAGRDDIAHRLRRISMRRSAVATFQASFAGALVAAPALVLCLLSPGLSTAQGLELFLSDQAANPVNRVRVPRLRPNVAQELYLYVESTEKTKVTVQILAGD